MVVNLKSQNNLSGFYIIYNGSTNIEEPGNYGISHLLEHLLCKTFDHMMDDFDRDGISWNAYTEANLINFHFTGLESRLGKYRQKILDAVSDFSITKEQFEMERNVVLSEYEDYFNNQAYGHAMNLHRKLFKDYDPIGLRSDLEGLKFIDCLNFYEKQFMHPSKIINVSKSNTLSDLDIEFNTPEITRGEVTIGDNDVEYELGNDFKDKTSLIMVAPLVKKDPAIVNYLNLMLSMGLRSPLYQEVREKKGLVYYVQCYQSRLNDTGINNISTLTNNKNVREVIETVDNVLSNPDKFLTKERYDIVNEYLTAKKEKEEILRYNFVGRHTTPEGWSIYDVLDTPYEKMREVYDQYYDFSKWHVSNDKKEFS